MSDTDGNNRRACTGVADRQMPPRVWDAEEEIEFSGVTLLYSSLILLMQRLSPRELSHWFYVVHIRSSLYSRFSYE